MRTRMNRPALLLSLLALGTLGLVASGVDADDQTIAASETETTRDVLAADNKADYKSCGYFGRYKFAVGGDVSCRRARRVLRAERHPAGSRVPGVAADRMPGGCALTKRGKDQGLGDVPRQVPLPRVDQARGGATPPALGEKMGTVGWRSRGSPRIRRAAGVVLWGRPPAHCATDRRAPSA
jgi:hypothetical protein